ncbi:MAG: oligoendopeptidase F, partial [Nitratireductor sp.]
MSAPTATQTTATSARPEATTRLGDLPEWNLADLYPAMDSRELARDLERAKADAQAFETDWRGKLAAEAEKKADTRLGEAMEAYDALEELIGRIVSNASLIYAGDTT